MTSIIAKVIKINGYKLTYSFNENPNKHFNVTMSSRLDLMKDRFINRECRLTIDRNVMSDIQLFDRQGWHEQQCRDVALEFQHRRWHLSDKDAQVFLAQIDSKPSTQAQETLSRGKRLIKEYDEQGSCTLSRSCKERN
jgi:hypothetical protein